MTDTARDRIAHEIIRERLAVEATYHESFTLTRDEARTIAWALIMYDPHDPKLPTRAEAAELVAAKFGRLDQDPDRWGPGGPEHRSAIVGGVLGFPETAPDEHLEAAYEDRTDIGDIY